jgi:ribosomal protein S6--L-glutamate ligase
VYACISLTDKPLSPGLTQYDAVLVRTMPAGSLEQIIFRMDALRAAEIAGVRVWNPPASLETCVDKYLTSVRLAYAGLPTPDLVCCQTWQDAMVAFKHLGGDVVVKPLFGSEGRGMVRLTDTDTAWRTFHTLANTGAVLYLQRFIQHPGWDMRLFVCGGTVIAAMRRSHALHWRTNIAQGGTATAVSVDEELESLALRAAKAVGVTIAGVDLIQNEHGQWFVLEVNGVPGWRALSECTEIDIATAVLQQILHVRS